MYILYIGMLCDARWLLLFVYSNEKNAALVIFSSRIKYNILKDKFRARLMTMMVIIIIIIIMKIKSVVDDIGSCYMHIYTGG